MKQMRWAILAAAAYYTLLSPGFAAAATWNQIKNGVICTECAPPYNLLAVTNTPTKTSTGVVQDNIDVYAPWDTGGVRVASCGPVVTTSTCTPTSTFSTGWVPIPVTMGGDSLPSAVGWGTTPGTAHREVFVTDDNSPQGVSYATRDGANAKAWVGPFSLGSPTPGLSILCSAPQAISQGPGKIAVFVIGCDHNLWHKYFPAQGTTNKWSDWINVTAGTEIDSFVLGDSPGNTDFALSVVYDNFSTGNTSSTSAYRQIHVIVSDTFNTIWDLNYVFDASKNYNPENPNSWELDSNLTMNTGGETTAAVSPLRKIAMFGNGAAEGSPQFLYGQSFTEQLDSFPQGPLDPTPETVNGGLVDTNPELGFRIAPAPVTFGKPGSSCSTFPACRNGVFFLNGASQNIQYSIWEGSSWNASFGTKTIGGAGDTFTANPAAVVSRQGTNAGKLTYVFAVREIDTTVNGQTFSTGQVWYATVVP
jgi:hypothetical protein